MEACKMLIGGGWVRGENCFDVRNPYTNEVLAKVPEASHDDVKSAVAAARKAFDANRELPAYRRSEILEKTSGLIAENKEEFARTISLESGIGREGVKFAVEEMTNIKMVSFNLG